MSETEKGDRVASQKIIGMQVIDTKGTLVGSVKDVGVDLASKQLVLYVTTKEKTDVEILSSAIQSMEDVILINSGETVPPAPPPPPSAAEPPAKVVCPNCKATLPGRAKFCAACGSKIT